MDLKKILNSIERTGYPVLPNLAKSYRDDATKPFSRFLKSIGIVAINKQIAGFHSFRVTFISKATAAGVDLKTIGGIVGHSSEKQTDRTGTRRTS
jgi:integrase